MDAKTPIAPNSPPGTLVTEGKTKKIHELAGRPGLVTLVSKDDITAGDGAKHDVIPEKGLLANRTTCNVFRLLKACGLPVAFEEQDSARSFIAPMCACCPTRWWCDARRTAPTSSATRTSPRDNCSRNRWSSSTSRPRTRIGRASLWSPTIR